MPLVTKNKEYGFHQSVDIPTSEELKKYYQKQYYQLSKGSYQKEYSEGERSWMQHRIGLKHHVCNKKISHANKKKFLDVGCGEGFSMEYFQKKNFEVKGVDFSSDGCARFHEHLLPNLLTGDIFELLEDIEASSFDIVLLDNVLEHAINPIELIDLCCGKLRASGILIVEVPNDFSIVQERLISEGDIDEEFWVVLPDHLSYFDKNSLIKICESNGRLSHLLTTADYPIDFNLFNPDSNYIQDATKGRNNHLSRVAIETLIFEQGYEKALDYWEALANLGMGRNITSYFVMNETL